MKIDRPLWGAGTLLSPQQFQQQARWEAWTNECLARLSRVHPWGVQVASFDLDALRLGKLKATRLRVRLPDGTLVDSDASDRLPPAVELARLATEEVAVATLLLALPLEHANGGNCLTGEGAPSRPTRYRQDWREVQDLYGEESQSMAALEHMLSLRLDSDENAEYLTCPVARVVRDGQGVWTLDPQFVPPLLSFDAQPQLLAQLDNLMTQLAAKRSRLMGMRRESNQRMADFAVADVSLFWLLNALNSYQPVLADLLAHPARHPEQVYQELIKLAGSLLTFSLEHDIGAIPGYRHDQLEAVFPPLFRLISTLLEASLPSRVIALELEQPNAHRWQVALHDGRLRDAEGVDFYLSVRSSLPAAQVQGQFPRLCKVGAPDDVDHLVNVALDGVPLLPLSHVPAAIPMRLGNQYFALDLAHPKARAMLSSGVCALYVPGTLGEVQLDLFAVLRS
ncbi:type VI secretion system protein ImpJ [Pseudomonas delhiensis]|uniref:Type VI secretion system protein ImpJ n=1 Tax=Pseudomonas delhiensis TaxID=366289 RepID=A0A239M2X6_9PSED|nr:type VI secretion system baseplate subunit TssK [Pseudomonas delhiensis]SDJ38577.1 type VI secretion system protein ImpJ [Pseudomonas delhiensis]SNT36478.1 type VI secretion system protein ImpJ [Pseudomonas delhiensis]